MRKYIILFLFVSLFTTVLNAQIWELRRCEASVGIGPTLFFGDIGGFSPDENLLGLRDLGLKQTRFNISGTVKYRILRDLNVRANLTGGTFHTSDLKGSNVQRAFESSTVFFEPYAAAEYYFIKNKAENNYLFLKNSTRYVSSLFYFFDFYVFTGIGANFFKVTGNDKLIERGMVDSGSSVIIPVGLGTTFIFTPELNFGMEICGRYAFSDYLEGYSSQYSNSKDVYYTVNLTVTYKFTTGPR